MVGAVHRESGVDMLAVGVGMVQPLRVLLGMLQCNVDHCEIWRRRVHPTRTGGPAAVRTGAAEVARVTTALRPRGAAELLRRPRAEGAACALARSTACGFMMERGPSGLCNRGCAVQRWMMQCSCAWERDAVWMCRCLRPVTSSWHVTAQQAPELERARSQRWSLHGARSSARAQTDPPQPRPPGHRSGIDRRVSTHH